MVLSHPFLRSFCLIFVFSCCVLQRRATEAIKEKLLLKEPDNGWKLWIASSAWLQESNYYVACGVGNTVKYHLITPFIQIPHTVKNVQVTVKYNVRSCDSFRPVPSPCKTKVEFLKKEQDLQSPLPGISDYNLLNIETPDTANLTTGPPGAVPPKITSVLSVNKQKRGVYLAIRVQSVCIALFSFEVSYGICASEGINLIKFPETVSPPAGSQSINVTGACVQHAVPIKKQFSILHAFCGSNSQWTADVNVSCVCIAGYQQKAVLNTCEECPAGTYKDVAANTMCRACPKNSKPGCLRDECVCKTGYFRVPVDQNETPCEALPPSPKLTVTTVISSTAAFISWFPAPRATRYSVECVMCSKAFTGYCYNCRRNVKFCPSRDSIPGTSVFISGLKPSTFFKFKVFSRNQLNEVVSKGKWNYLQVNLKTKSSV